MYEVDLETAPTQVFSMGDFKKEISVKLNATSLRQREVEQEIRIGNIVDPESGFIPLDKLDRENPRGLANVSGFSELVSGEPQNEQAAALVDDINSNLKNGAALGIYDKDGTRRNCIWFLNSPQSVQKNMLAGEAKTGEYFVIYSEPQADENNSKPVVLQIVSKGKIQYIPWKADTRFINLSEAETMTDLVARGQNLRRREKSSGDTQIG